MKRSLLALPRSLLIAAGLLLAFVAVPAFADPPARAARISLVSGSASFSPAGSEEWVQARINRPIWVGDRLWAGDGRIELQIGGASLRLAPRTSLQVLNFDDRIAQFEVTQGSVALHVRRIDSDETIEIDTPSFAFVTHEEGDYRIDVERDYTAVSTRRGFADIYGQNVSYRIDRRERFAFYSPDLRDYDAGPLPPPDAFDRWARERALREDRSTSARYVSPELVGYADLDSYGEWRVDATYGNVWVPRVDVNWAPYRYGNWTWVDPWGWTWIDDAPWGFAPSHYGRWTQLGRTWAWVPGPRTVRPVYSPALVAWVGGDNFSLTVSSGRTRGVGWFPLAPGEVWRPSYDVSRDYFTRVNVANTVVNNTTVINVYNTRNDVRVNNEYRFRASPAAVTAVPVETFVQSRPVQSTQAQLSANAAAQANVLPAAPAHPVMQSLVGAAPRSQAKPPAESVQRPVVARTAPAAVPSIEQRAVLVREGKPVDREAIQRAPQAAQPAPQRPSTAAPAGGQPPAAQAPAPAGQPPVTAVAPGQSRANVRVVEADKAAPKPLPPAAEGGSRAARNEAEKGRPPSSAAPQPAQQTGQPPGSPPQAAKPAPPAQLAQPAPSPQATPPGRPQIAAPPAGEAQPPAAASGGQPPIPGQPAQAAPPARTPPMSQSAQPSPPGREGPQAGPRDGPPRGPPGGPAQGIAPAPAPVAPAPTARPPADAPTAKAPGAAPPNADQLRGRERREAEAQDRTGGPPDNRRAQPAQGQPTPQVAPQPPTPKSAEPPPPARESRQAPAPGGPAAPLAARPSGEERRATTPAGVPPQPPSKPPEAQPRPSAAPAPPAAQPPQPPGRGAAEKKPQEREGERERGKDKDKDGREKEKDPKAEKN